MKNTVTLTLLAFAMLAVGYWYSTSEQAPITDPPIADIDEPPKSIPVPRLITEQQQSSTFEIDRERLYDLSYLADPDLIAFAEAHDVSAECIVKVERGEATMSDRPVCERISIAAHTLDSAAELANLTLEQLLPLAQTDAQAAALVSQAYYYLGEFDKQEQYVERAVALSGKANTLFGLLGVDRGVDSDVLEYELLLIAEALGRKTQPEHRFMAIHGLSPQQVIEAQQRAEARLQRLTEMRQELVGKPWGIS